MNWDDLDSDARELQQAQDDLERMELALSVEPPNQERSRVYREHLKVHLQRTKRFIEALIRMKQ